MNRKNIMNRLFSQALEDGGVVSWCKNKPSYAKYKKRNQLYQNKLFSFAQNKLSEKDYSIFQDLLQKLKDTMIDLDLEEKEFYFNEGYKEGIKQMKELFK